MTPQELSKRVGGYAKVASIVGLRSHTAVMRWDQVPAKYLIEIERVTGIPREQLRPDLYRPTPAEASA